MTVNQTEADRLESIIRVLTKYTEAGQMKRKQFVFMYSKAERLRDLEQIELVRGKLKKLNQNKITKQNKLFLIGRVGQPSVTKHFEGENQVSTFSLATTERFKNKRGEKVEETEWHNIVAWGGLSIVTERYIKKGALLSIEGKIKSRKYQDNDGVTRYRTEVIARTIQMLEKREPSSSMPTAEDAPPRARHTEAEIERQGAESSEGSNDDLPF